MIGSFKFKSVIICDDARFELNGKEFLIGIYSGGINTHSFPIVMPTLVFRFEVLATHERFQTARMRVENDKNERVLTGEVNWLDTNEPLRVGYGMPLTFRFSPVIFPSPGEHTIFFAIDDEPREVDTIMLNLL